MTKSFMFILIIISFSVLLVSCSESVVPQNWEQITYVTEVHEPELTNCRNITPEKDDLAYVRINKSTQEVIHDSRAVKVLYTTICNGGGSPVDIRERKGISKEDCINYCTKKACAETNNIPGNKLNWSFYYADFESVSGTCSGTCSCTCTPYNTSKVINILE